MSKRMRSSNSLINAAFVSASVLLAGPAFSQSAVPEGQSAQTTVQDPAGHGSGSANANQRPTIGLGIPFVDYGAGAPVAGARGFGIPFVDYGAGAPVAGARGFGIPFVDYGAGAPVAGARGFGIPFVDYGAGVPVYGARGFGIPFVDYGAGAPVYGVHRGNHRPAMGFGIPFVDYGAGVPVIRVPQYALPVPYYYGYPAGVYRPVVRHPHSGANVSSGANIQAQQPVICLMKPTDAADKTNVAVIAQTDEQCGAIGGTVSAPPAHGAAAN